MDPRDFQSEEKWITAVKAQIDMLIQELPSSRANGYHNNSASPWSDTQEEKYQKQSREFERERTNEIMNNSRFVLDATTALNKLKRMCGERTAQLTAQKGLTETENGVKFKEEQEKMRETKRIAAAEKLASDNAERKRAEQRAEQQRAIEWDNSHDSMYGRQGSRMEQLQRLSVNPRSI